MKIDYPYSLTQSSNNLSDAAVRPLSCIFIQSSPESPRESVAIVRGAVSVAVEAKWQSAVAGMSSVDRDFPPIFSCF